MWDWCLFPIGTSWFTLLVYFMIEILFHFHISSTQFQTNHADLNLSRRTRYKSTVVRLFHYQQVFTRLLLWNSCSKIQRIIFSVRSNPFNVRKPLTFQPVGHQTSSFPAHGKPKMQASFTPVIELAHELETSFPRISFWIRRVQFPLRDWIAIVRSGYIMPREMHFDFAPYAVFPQWNISRPSALGYGYFPGCCCCRRRHCPSNPRLLYIEWRAFFFIPTRTSWKLEVSCILP